MKNHWNETMAAEFSLNPLLARVYSARLLGQDADLVLHGGGNTSVKANVTNLFGDSEAVLYVKGSGWDLATIEEAGFPAVKLDVLRRMAELDILTDTDMVMNQRAAMINPDSPTPSVEAILHAIIPPRFVDHTHADAVVTISNTENGAGILRDLYGDSVLVVPYIMPGFALAKQIYQLTKDIEWAKLEGIILLSHGVFSFAEDAKTSYDRMISIVSRAEEYLSKYALISPKSIKGAEENLIGVAQLRKQVSVLRGKPQLALTDAAEAALSFAARDDVSQIATRGPLTPDHVIRTKRSPLIIKGSTDASLRSYEANYRRYFETNTDSQLTCLDVAPRWAIWPGQGIISFGSSLKEARIVSDIKDHTIKAIQHAEMLGGWKALPQKDIFDVEYWELEQVKLRKEGSPPAYQGKIVVVTGGASGIGLACAKEFAALGAVVAVLDIDDGIESLFQETTILGIKCDVSSESEVFESIATVVRKYGGIDVLVSNAGIFPRSERIEDLQKKTWDKSIEVNLTSHKVMMKAVIPFLEQGIDPAIVIIASKNVLAPGPGASAYSVAKAGLTQLGRVAALELAPKGIRVNMLHPDAVFDTAIWTDKVLEARAKSYGLSVNEYKTKNLLKTELSSENVAKLVACVAGDAFAKTTGAQIPIDGGNERVV